MTASASPPPLRPQRSCTTCGRPFAVPANNPGKRYCTPRCRVADWHHRHDRAAVSRPVAAGAGNGVLAAVSANNGVPIRNGVPNAVTRCPHCGQPVAVINLLVVPAAAHIATPAATDA